MKYRHAHDICQEKHIRALAFSQATGILMLMEEVTLRAFSENLVRLMAKRNMSQSELARRTGIRQQTISSYCRGQVFPSFNRMIRIAEALHISFFDLTMQKNRAISAEIKKRK